MCKNTNEVVGWLVIGYPGGYMHMLRHSDKKMSNMNASILASVFMGLS